MLANFLESKSRCLFQYVLSLDELLERAVERRADVRHILPKVDGRESPLADALGGELELL